MYIDEAVKAQRTVLMEKAEEGTDRAILVALLNIIYQLGQLLDIVNVKKVS